MDLAAFWQALLKTIPGERTVNHDGNPRAQAVARAKTVAKAGKALVKLVNHGAERRSLQFDGVQAAAQVAMKGWDPDFVEKGGGGFTGHGQLIRGGETCSIVAAAEWGTCDALSTVTVVDR